MSARSTRATRASAAAGVATASVKSRSRKSSTKEQEHDTNGVSTAMDVDVEDEKENGDVKEGTATLRKPTGTTSASAPPSASTKRTSGRTRRTAGVGTTKAVQPVLKPVDCICAKGDDGSPMIYCSECRIWYHFTCVDLNEPDAEEINVYICPTCTQTTGRRSAMFWEGDQAVEEVTDDETNIVERQKAALKTRKQVKQRPAPERINFDIVIDESDGAVDSEDEYVEEKAKMEPGSKRASRLQRLPSLSGSDEDSDDETGTKRRRRLSRVKPERSSSPIVHPHLKRKATSSSTGAGHAGTPPPTKRKRSGTNASASHSTNAADDPARKYCLGKLEELFKEVFLRYPHAHVPSVSLEEEEEEQDSTMLVQKKPDELSEAETEALLEESRQFAKELESCVFDIYAEPDKAGYPHAGPKYKDRFRMLQFNLSKPDRVIIHQRITSGKISAKEISTMSSTDLADEETKQSIKLAEKEALEHSILLKSTVPRAKITHKGLQDIEEVNGDVVSARELERRKEREQEDEERRERERMARLRTGSGPGQQGRQRTASMSVPPESPTTAQSLADQQQQQSWGGPPPVPMHAMASSIEEDVQRMQQQQRPPLFLHSSSDFLVGATPEPELNLTDLINIDEDQEGSTGFTATEGAVGANMVAQEPSVSTGPNFVASPIEGLPPQSPSSAMSTTGISPFAQRQRTASFDLNSLWNVNNSKEDTTPGTPTDPTAEADGTATGEPPVDENPQDSRDETDSMELESVEANDQDFDMFLEEQEQEQEPEEPLLIISNIEQPVENLPQVWNGKITMPLDSTVPQETMLDARQIGGKPLAADSPLWKTLFPSDILRIEGRVPIDNSVKYLLQMRMNATKELYAAAFVPSTRQNEEDFKIFCNFLISKSRHGLVFPWGNRPKDYHPGRELYMIPLLQSEPLPEFIELLDDLKLPKTRSRDYLIGVWILNKGKLAPLPGPPSHSVTPVQQPQPAIPNAMMNNPMFNTPPHASLMSPASSVPSVPPMVAPSALAAEVASLTPEQIQSLLRTLSSTSQVPPPPVAQPAPPPLGHLPLPHFNQNRPPMPTPPMGQHTPPVPPGQPWMQQHPPMPPAASFPMNFPPANVPFQQPLHAPHNMNGPPPPPSAPYDRQYDDRGGPNYRDDRDFRPGPHHNSDDRDYDHRGERGERGWRGQNNNRGGRGGSGRGRGRGDMHQGPREGDRDFNARRDGGWPRRSRNDSGQGGPSW